MTWSLETPVRAGGIACVPVVDSFVSVTANAHRIAGHGQKRPVLFLLFQKGAVTALDFRGRVRTVDDIERRYPGVLSKAAALVRENDT